MKSNNKSKSKSTLKTTKMTKNEKAYYQLCREMEALKLNEK